MRVKPNCIGTNWIHLREEGEEGGEEEMTNCCCCCRLLLLLSVPPRLLKARAWPLVRFLQLLSLRFSKV